MLSYFSQKRTKTPPPPTHEDDTPAEPVLNDDDEAFLQRITSADDIPPPLPERHPQDLPEAGSTKGNNAQIALMNGAQDVPLPNVPDTPDGVLVAIEGGDAPNSDKGKGKAADNGKASSMLNKWSFLRRDSRDNKKKDASLTATDLHNIAEGLKAPSAKPNEDGIVTPGEANKEEEEMTQVLEQLNLAAVNNRVFSISKESQELLRKFTLVLKDLVNGVPTAYDDLEALLNNSQAQLQESFSSLPSFLQKLIKSLPSKFTGGPPPKSGEKTEEGNSISSFMHNAYFTQAAGAAMSAAGSKVRIPTLKDLVTKPGAVTSMLRTIMTFLRTRFPAFMGMNVLWSLALFVLLFVFWYCHKRGREKRLEKERELTEKEIEAIEKEYAAEKDEIGTENSTQMHGLPDVMTTTAPPGASLEEVRAGMIEVERAEEEAKFESNQDQGAATYAEGGSLAKELKKEAEAKNASQDASTDAPTSGAIKAEESSSTTAGAPEPEQDDLKPAQEAAQPPSSEPTIVSDSAAAAPDAPPPSEPLPQTQKPTEVFADEVGSK